MTYTILIFAYRKPGTTPAEFKSHYETKHMPLSRSIAGSTFPPSHTRRYIHRTSTSTSTPPSSTSTSTTTTTAATTTSHNATTPATVFLGAQADFDYDAFAELVFEDEAACRTFFAVTRRPENAARQAADADAFLDRMTVVALGRRSLRRGSE